MSSLLGSFHLEEKLIEYSKFQYKNQKEKIAVNHVVGLKKEKDELQKANENLINNYNTILDENECIIYEKNVILQENEELKKELSNTHAKYSTLNIEFEELKEDIKELEKAYNFNYKEFKSRLRKSNSNEKRYKNS